MYCKETVTGIFNDHFIAIFLKCASENKKKIKIGEYLVKICTTTSGKFFETQCRCSVKCRVPQTLRCQVRNWAYFVRHRIEQQAVADSRIRRRIFVRRKFAKNYDIPLYCLKKNTSMTTQNLFFS